MGSGRVDHAVLEKIARAIGEPIEYVDEFTARRTLGDSFSRDMLEEVPGRGPCVACFSEKAVRKFAKLVAERDPSRREAARTLIALVDTTVGEPQPN